MYVSTGVLHIGPDLLERATNLFPEATVQHVPVTEVPNLSACSVQQQ